MGRYNLVERSIGFYRKNGLQKTFSRGWLSLRRMVWQSEMVLFYTLLGELSDIKNDQLYSFKIERIKREEDIPDLAFRRLLNHWNETIMRRHIKERFGKGAVLWLAKLGKNYAGFGWSIIGTPIEPYFFPLTDTDIHFFNFHIFPEYRGRGINPLLVNHMLLLLKQEGLERAFIETHAWNKAEIRSIEKTYFHKLGEVRKVTIFGKPIVYWSKISFQERAVGQKCPHSGGDNKINDSQ